MSGFYSTEYERKIDEFSLRELIADIEHKRGIALDDFQKEAIYYLFEGFDVLVSAPTGSGKTLIAEVKIEDVLARGGRVWYSSPLKALSNDKYRDFKNLFGHDKVGILTGDRKENPQANLLVGTTEIFRNIIIEKGIGNEVDVDFIVFDEAHWIKDKERGVVWEEAIIFAPKKTQLLLLSATFPNVEEIALWISKIREREVKVVYKTQRPVPLEWYSIGKDIKPLFTYDGKVSSSNYIKVDLSSATLIENTTEFSLLRTIAMMKKRGVLPAIFFLSSRRECEEKSIEIAELIKEGKIKIGDESDIERRRDFCKPYFETFPYLRDNIFVENFILTGVAPHHAGLIPAMKILFEDALKVGLAYIIFATKTLASGIDVPAKSVVIVDKYTFDGEKERLLSPSEVVQMAGRAGRRGKDDVGYVFISSPLRKHEIVKIFGEIEPITSSFYITPHLTLNLLKSMDVSQCIQLIRKSLKFFEISSKVESWKRKLDEVKEKRDFLLSSFYRIKPEYKKCSIRTNISFSNTKNNIEEDEKKIKEIDLKIYVLGKIIEGVQKSSALESQISFQEENPEKIFPERLGKEIFLFCVDSRGRFGFLVSEGNNTFRFESYKESKVISPKKISFCFEVDLSQEKLSEEIHHDIFDFVKNNLLIHFHGRSFRKIYEVQEHALNLVRKLSKIKSKYDEKNRKRAEEIERFPCFSCPVFSECSAISFDFLEIEKEIGTLERKNPDEVEREFRNMLEFLKYLGYLDENYMLTEKGWNASEIKNPRSIYIYEAIDKGVLGYDPVELAKNTALILSEPKPPFVKPPEKIERGIIERIYKLELKFNLPPKVKPAEIIVRSKGQKQRKYAFCDGKIYKAVHLWAKGYDIDFIEEEVGVEVGDLSRMITQVVEVLRQLEKIYGYKEPSRIAIQKIYRSPISDFVD
jgi:superfamily II RNA helicase